MKNDDFKIGTAVRYSNSQSRSNKDMWSIIYACELLKVQYKEKRELRQHTQKAQVPELGDGFIGQNICAETWGPESRSLEHTYKYSGNTML